MSSSGAFSLRVLPALALLTISLVAGCTSEWVTTGGSASPTDGLSIDMFMEGQAQQMVQYRLNGTGRLWYSGGRDVGLDRSSWSGMLTAAQGRVVAQNVAEGDWFSRTPPTGDGSESHTWTIKAWGPAGEHANFTVYGNADSVSAVYDVLKAASSARFDSFIKELPKPSIDRDLERKQAQDSAADADKADVRSDQ